MQLLPYITTMYISCISTYIPLLTLILVMQVVYGFSVVSLKDKGQAKQRSLQISVYSPEMVCEEINNLLFSFIVSFI